MERVVCGCTGDGSLEALQKEILTSIARGYPLADVMLDLCHRVESLAPDVTCSVLRIDKERRLRTVAAPSLPEHYSQAIDGLQIGPDVGSCGTAAFLGRPVEVRDIEVDPLWTNYKALALPLGLRACWSSPITAKGRVVGTFAFYFPTARGPSDLEQQVVSACVHLCAIAIEQSEFREKINHLAYYDQLTGLGNRAMLRDRLVHILDEAAKESTRVAILYLDLDGFKAVNDLHGHAAGDRLLYKVAERLRELAADADLIIRLGGDEFLVVQRESSPRSGGSLAGELAMGLRGSYELEHGIETAIGVSIGVATFPDDGADLATLIAHADTALYRVKNGAAGGFSLFEPIMEVEQLERRALERDVSAAVDLNQMHMVYQPIVSAQTGKVAAFEALLRWNEPTRGSVPPDVFIAAAESSGAIERIGDLRSGRRAWRLRLGPRPFGSPSTYRRLRSCWRTLPALLSGSC